MKMMKRAILFGLLFSAVSGRARAANTIPVGASPTAIATNGRTGHVFIANNAAPGTITVLDGNTNAVITSIAVADFPNRVVVDEIHNWVFVSSATSDVVQILDGALNQVNVDICRAAAAPGASSCADADTNLVADLAFDPVNLRLYVASTSAKRLNVFDLDTSGGPITVGAHSLDSLPLALAFDVTFNQAAVLRQDAKVGFIDGSSFTQRGTVTLPQNVRNATSLALNPRTEKLYVNGNMVSIIDTKTLQVSGSVSLIAFGVSAADIAVNPSLNRLYATTGPQPITTPGSVFIFDTNNANTLLRTVPTGANGMFVAALSGSGFVDQGEDHVFVTNVSDGTVTEFDDELITNLLVVPLRACVVEGSPAADGISPTASSGSGLGVACADGTTTDSSGTFLSGDATTAAAILGEIQQTDDVWLKQAGISFRVAAGSTIPVVACSGDCVGQATGNVSAPGLIDPGSEVVANCEAAWKCLNGVSQNARVVVSVNQLQNNGGVAVTAPGLAGALNSPSFASRSLYGAAKYDAICNSAHTGLMTADLPSLYTLVNDPSTLGLAPTTLAHELGHILSLGHGNGVDDDLGQPTDVRTDGTVGTAPPNPGVRDYDGLCSYLGESAAQTSKEDDMFGPTPETCDNSSLMWSGSACTALRDLQIEQARAIAAVTPDVLTYNNDNPLNGQMMDSRIACTGPSCAPPEVQVIDGQLSEAAGAGTTGFTVTLDGAIPTSADNQYLLFADLDDNPATGCSPAAAGFGTSFAGAELVTQVVVQGSGSALVATPTVWTCAGGSWSAVSDSRITSEILYTSHPAVVAFVPDDIRGAVAGQVRLQAVAQQLGTGGSTGLLPASGEGEEVALILPPQPSCAISPSFAQAGETAALFATNMPANTAVNVQVGHQSAGTGTTDGSGQLHMTFTVPVGLTPGLTSVDVMASGTAAYADCPIQVHQTPGQTCAADTDCFSGVCRGGACCAGACGACGVCDSSGACAAASAGAVPVAPGCDNLTCDGSTDQCPYTINIDARALTLPSLLVYSAPGTPIFDTNQVAQVQLLPGAYNLQVYSSLISPVGFTVAADGTVDYDASMEPFLSGRGTKTLVVTGCSVQLDMSLLSQRELPLFVFNYPFFDTQSLTSINVLPLSGYSFWVGPGIYSTFGFAVGTDCSVQVSDDAGAFASSSGSTVTLSGVPIVVTPGPGVTDLEVGQFIFDESMSNAFVTLSTTAPSTVRLLPVTPFTYGLYVNGVAATLNVDNNGNAVCDSVAAPYLSGCGTPAITVNAP